MSVRFVAHPWITKATSPGSRWVREMDATMRRKLAVPLRRELEKLQGKVKVGALESAVRARNVKRVLELALVDEVGSIVASLGEALEDPMLKGARSAMVELGRKVVAVDMYRPRFEAWIERHTAGLVKEINGTSRKAVRGVLTEGIKQGRHPRALARDLRSIVGLTEPQSVSVERLRQGMIEAGVPEAKVEARATRYAEGLLKRRAQIIAQHETMTAINAGRHELWAQLAADGDLEPGVQRQWITAIDEAVCPICKPMHLQSTTIGGSYTTGRGDSVDSPPAHVSCLLPGAVVGNATVRGATRRSYSGDAVQLDTSLGATVTVTPNHPILTPNGFVPAGMVRQGARVFCGPVHQGVPLVDPNGQVMPALAEEVFYALRFRLGVLPVQVPTGPADFHGDGSVDGQADVVGAASFLDRGGQAKRAHLLRHHFAQRGGVELNLLSRFGLLSFLRLGQPDSTRRFVRGRNLLAALLVAHLLPLQRLGLASPPDGHSSADQAHVDHVPVCSVCLGQSVDGFPGDVSGSDFLAREVQQALAAAGDCRVAMGLLVSLVHLRAMQSDAFGCRTQGDPGAEQTGPHGPGAESGMLGNTVDGKPGAIQTTNLRDTIKRYRLRVARVTHVASSYYSGPVYNLETESGAYTAGGIAARNCRCTDVLI